MAQIPQSGEAFVCQLTRIPPPTTPDALMATTRQRSRRHFADARDTYETCDARDTRQSFNTPF
jgi:hypothetical protein